MEEKDYNLLGIIAAFFMVGMMGTRPLVPLYTKELGVSSIEIGIVVSMYPLLSLFLAVHIGKVIDRIGVKKPLIWSSIIGSLSLMLPFIATNFAGIIASQIIAGITMTFFVVAAQSYAGHSSKPSKREQNIMKFSIGTAIGSFIGPLSGGYLADWFSSSLTFFILGAVSIFSALLALLLTEFEDVQPAKKRPPLGNLSSTFRLLKISNVRRAFLISSLILLGKDMFTAYFPLLALEFGLSSSSIGVIVSINALAGILIRWFMPQLIEWIGKSNVIVISVFTAGLLFVSLPFFHHEVILGCLSFLLGMGLGIGQPLSISTTLNSLPKDRVAEGLGFRLTVNRFTQTTAPFVFGVVAHAFGMASVFYITGALILIGSTKTRINEELLEKGT
ncbi:MFS transporter [Pueribacillus theae]|uniref:MFS transporter n=1 Tax=Pueribacillus theae TaxID=2171751 RepID=UPI001401DBD6|nr:MFS transporter [Pueribacillus theae]